MVLEYDNEDTGRPYRVVIGRTDRRPVTEGVRLHMLGKHVQELCANKASSVEQLYWAARAAARKAAKVHRLG